MSKWILVLLSLVVAILSALVIFTITGVIEPQDKLLEWAESVEWLNPYIVTYSKGLDAEQWRSEEQQQIQQAWQEIEEERSRLGQLQDEIAHEQASLQRERQQLEDQLRALEERQATLRSIGRLAELYQEMPTQESSRILQTLDDDLILAILLELDPRDAAEILTRFPTELAASLSNKLRELQ